MPDKRRRDGRNQKGERHHSTDHDKSITKPPENLVCMIPTPLPVCILPDSECEKRCIEESRIQKAQLRTARQLNLITLLGVIGGFLSLGLIYLQIKRSDEATVLANRAWIAPVGADIPLLFNKSGDLFGGPVHFSFKYKNIGKQPAFDFTVGKMFSDTISGVPILHPGEELPVKKVDTCSDPVVGNQPIWPSDQPGEFVFDLEDQNFINDFPAIVNSKKTLYFEGCYTYRTFNIVHHSAFCYYLRLIGDHPPGEYKEGDKIQTLFVVCPNKFANRAD